MVHKYERRSVDISGEQITLPTTPEGIIEEEERQKAERKPIPTEDIED